MSKIDWLNQYNPWNVVSWIVFPVGSVLSPNGCPITITNQEVRMSVWCTSRTRGGAADHTTASSLRNRCLHAGPSSTTSATATRPGERHVMYLCDLLIQDGYHFKSPAGFSLIWTSGWAKMEAMQGSRKWTILVFLRNRWWNVYCLKHDSYVLRPWSFPKPSFTQFFTHNRSFLRECRPFGWRMKEESFMSVAKWEIHSHLVVQSTHLNVSHVKLPGNRNENLSTLQD